MIHKLNFSYNIFMNKLKIGITFIVILLFDTISNSCVLTPEWMNILLITIFLMLRLEPENKLVIHNHF